MIKAENQATGEIIEMEVNSLEDLVDAWQIAQEYEKTADSLKDQLKPLVDTYVGDRGVSDEVKGTMFRVSSVQRKTYDKSVVREVFDEDTFDLFIKIDKKAVDMYLKENLEEVGEASTLLRKSMVADGDPYQVIKLEKLDRKS